MGKDADIKALFTNCRKLDAIRTSKNGKGLVDCREFTGRTIMRPLNDAREDYAARCKIVCMTLCENMHLKWFK